MAQQPGPNLAIRAHIPHKLGQPQQQYVFTQPQVQLMYPGTQLSMYRYTTPQYPQTQYQQGQSYVVTQQQPQIYTGYPGHVFYPTPAVQPQSQMHQAAQPYYQPTAMSMQESKEVPKRQRRILNFLNPITAEKVIKVSEGAAPSPSASPQPTEVPFGIPELGQYYYLKHHVGTDPTNPTGREGHAADQEEGIVEEGKRIDCKQEFYLGITEAAESTTEFPDQEGILEEEKRIDCKQEFYLRITEAAAERCTGDGSDEAGEPIRKRIVYDRDTLMSLKGSASKAFIEGIDSIPRKLIRDRNATSSVSPIPRPQIGGGYVGAGGGGYGRMQQGGRMWGSSMGTFPGRVGTRGQGQQNWIHGDVGFQLPSPPPGPNRPPITISLKKVKLDKAENPWKPGRNVDTTKAMSMQESKELPKRERKILNIWNPTTGKVIKAVEGAAPSPSASPQPTEVPFGIPELGQYYYPKHNAGTDPTNPTGCEAHAADQEEGIVEEGKKIDCKQEFYLRITEAAESTTEKMKVYGKVYSKPPTGVTKSTKQGSKVSEDRRESGGSADLDLSRSSRSLKDGSRSSSADLTGIRAKAKVIQPRSATSTVSRTKGSSINSSTKSSPLTLSSTNSGTGDEVSEPILPDDAVLFSQSDKLFEEVLALCGNGGGRDLLVTSPPCRIDDSGDKFGTTLTSLPSLSLLSSVANTPLTTARPGSPNGYGDHQVDVGRSVKMDSGQGDHPEDKECNGQGDVVKTLPPQSPSPEYDFRKVFGILRMIEEEEAKGSEIPSCLEAFLKSQLSSVSSSASELLRGTRPHSAPSAEFRVESKLSDKFSPPRRLPAGTGRESVLSLSPRELSPPLISFRSLTTGEDLEEVKGQTEDWPPGSSRSSQISESWENFDVKSQTLFSFLDEVDQSDRDKLFQLKFQHTEVDPVSMTVTKSRSRGQGGQPNQTRRVPAPSTTQLHSDISTASKLDTLIRKGSAELAREILMMDRALEDSAHNVHILEETLLSQRELNMRNMKNSDKESKKRLKLQQEEFELTLSRHSAFVDQLIVEKRNLQEKCEKILKESKEADDKFQKQIDSLQAKHLEEIKRLRKIADSTEKTKKQKWVGQKTQEIRDLTVKGLEPEVHRLIQRHQQELAETRAYYSDEIQELEERYARKQTHQLHELRENFGREKEEACRRERDLAEKRFQAEFQRQLESFEQEKRRWKENLREEQERLAKEVCQVRDGAQETIRKEQIKLDVQMDNLRQDYDLKLAQLEKRHEREISSLRDNFQAQRDAWQAAWTKKTEQELATREASLVEALTKDKELEVKEREKKIKEHFEKVRAEEESAQESRIKRLQEKFQGDLDFLEKSERELQSKLNLAKTDLLTKDEELFSLKTALGLKSKEASDLAETNLRMLEERANLTSIIRREFASQIEVLEQDCVAVKTAVVDLKAKHKSDLDHRTSDFVKLKEDKEAEFERIGARVKATLGRKEETLMELGKQLEKQQIHINHLELLLEQQRQDFVQSITSTATTGTTKKK